MAQQPQQQSQTTPTTPATPAYTYGAYYQSGTTGTYAYPAGYPAGVTSYWPYAYNYAQNMYVQQQQAQAQSTATPAATTATATTTPSAAPATQTSTLRMVNTTNASYQSGQNTRETTTTTTRAGRKSSTRGMFTKELKNLMFGFGDDRNPANDTVNVLEEILIEYLADVCTVAGGPSKKPRLSIEDIRRALSHPADASKLARLEELLFMQEDIKRARAQFDDKETRMA